MCEVTGVIMMRGGKAGVLGRVTVVSDSALVCQLLSEGVCWGEGSGFWFELPVSFTAMSANVSALTVVVR